MQYKKLFHNSEIEYITPFLKLWMAFNNWYKKDQPTILRDADAINFYKSQWILKDKFFDLFGLQSDTGIHFCNWLYELVLYIKQYPLRYPNWSIVQYSQWMILENSDTRWGKEPIYISTEKKRFQILSEKKDDFYAETLEIIYQIRCNLVHGNFDLENQYFLSLVKSCYNIMHPLMQRVFESQADWQFMCESLKKNTSATWIFMWWKMKVLSGSRITKEVVGSYDKKGRRTHILKEKAIEHDDHYELKEHIMFDSPSAASSFCLWNSSNGRLDWKNRLWKTMDELLRNNE